MRIREMGEKFIVPDNDPNKNKIYSERSNFLDLIREKEKEGNRFFTVRTEQGDGQKYQYDTSSLSPNEDIEYAHGISFLNQVIPEILERFAKQDKKRKIKILDLGGGVGLFADQIRERFGEKVAVYTTSAFGSSEKTRKELVEKKKTATKNKEAKLHKLDAYKTSIGDFRDFPEFDLIIDTYGEMYYTQGNFTNSDAQEKVGFKEKIDMVIKKLQEGGRLFLGKVSEDLFIYLWSLDSQPQFKDVKVTFNGLSKKEWTEELKKINLIDDGAANNPPNVNKVLDYIYDSCDGDLDNLSDQSFAALLKRTFILHLSICVEKIG
ncbi:MAG TPA: hypothetical protein PKY08_03360 [Candidatus Magasanikbacteria bacterium]|nr:hypothetical protein [Candidatus Magasanikbacteria bacterium]